MSSVSEALANVDKDNLSLENLIRSVDYKALEDSYVPSAFALQFISFIKLVNGEEGEENTSPLFHYQILDDISKYKNNLVVAFRGSAKTSLTAEYLFLYIAVFGKLPGFGEINVAMYVGDTMDNGCKNLRNNIEHRYRNSEFLQKFIPDIRFTDVRLEFTNADGHKFCVKMFGANPLALDEKLYLKDGTTTTIGECKVGDIIFDANGLLTTIVDKSEVFNKPTYRITLDDGRSLKVSEDHLNVITEKLHNYKKYKDNTWHYEDKIYTTLELLSKPLKHYNKIKKTSQNLLFIPTPNAIGYSNKELPLDPYTLGLLLGDGSLKHDGSSTLTAHKEDMCEYITFIPYELGSLYTDKRHSNVQSLSIKGISKQIEQLGLRGSNSYTKFIPNDYKISSVNQRLELLRGLLDTDGSISSRKRRPVVYFSTTSKQLALDITDIVRSLGGYTKTSEYVSKQGKANSFKVFIHINENIFKLTRKKQLQKFDDKNGRVAITSIEQIPTIPTQCIRINNCSHKFITTDYIVTHNTGVRGFKEYGQRPVLAVLDDLFTDKAAESKTIIKDIENVIYKAVRQALHPTRRKVVWIGTPFNKKDPLYRAAATTEWHTRVFPICERFPCSRKDFVGAWEDRFPYEAVMSEYSMLKSQGRIDAFNQELMLRILSDEDRLVLDEDIVWFKRNDVLENLANYHVYITTDFATSETESSDFSVISVWALDCKGRFHWIDGVVTRQDMAKNVDDVFRFAEMYQPLSVGVEISGQQKGFVSWLRRDMATRGKWFTVASDKSSGEEGLRPTTSKLVRFNAALPLFKQRKIAFPEELRNSSTLLEFIDELFSVTPSGFKSEHDDCADTISQLVLLDYIAPSDPSMKKVSKRVADDDRLSYYFTEPEEECKSSYIV